MGNLVIVIYYIESKRAQLNAPFWLMFKLIYLVVETHCNLP